MAQKQNIPGYLHETGDAPEPTEMGLRALSQSTGGGEENPYDNEFARAKADTQAAETKRREHWKRFTYDAALLGGIDSPWAVAQAATLDRKNALRDPVKSVPTLWFSGAEAVDLGAMNEQLAALTPLRAIGFAALRIRAAAEVEYARNQVRGLARKLAAEREGGTIAPPEPVSLADMLAAPDDPAAYRIEGLWPLGGRVLLSAQYKAGKSTMVGNVMRALVDGGEFLGRFIVTPVSKVVLIDTELDTRTLRRWLREQGIRNSDAVTVVSLRGKVSAFDIMDRAGRVERARLCAGAEVGILDCVRPALDALGLSEDKDAGKFLVAFDELLAEIGAGEALVVTHMGHMNERARGDSRLLDWPDALWKIVRDPKAADTDDDAKRYFEALGRDVKVGEGLLSYDAVRRWLSYEGGNRRDSVARTLIAPLRELLKDEPGLSGADIERRLLENVAEATQKGVRDVLKVARKEGLVRIEQGPRRAILHYLKEGDPLAGNE